MDYETADSGRKRSRTVENSEEVQSIQTSPMLSFLDFNFWVCARS